jgi:hypothetical protein
MLHSVVLAALKVLLATQIKHVKKSHIVITDLLDRAKPLCKCVVCRRILHILFACIFAGSNVPLVIYEEDGSGAAQLQELENAK